MARWFINQLKAHKIRNFDRNAELELFKNLHLTKCEEKNRVDKFELKLHDVKDFIHEYYCNLSTDEKNKLIAAATLTQRGRTEQKHFKFTKGEGHQFHCYFVAIKRNGT